MPTIMMLYPAYGTVSCHEVCRNVELVGDIKMVLADDVPTTSDLDIFDEVWELPEPERLDVAWERLRRWCTKKRPDGIFLQSERGLLLGSLVAREFGLKAPSVKAAHLCSNKYLQRETLAHAGIGNPVFRLGESARDVSDFGAKHGFPLVLKCVISTMSRLVTLVNGPDEIEAAVDRVRDGILKSRDVERLLNFAKVSGEDLGCDPRRQFLIESFLTGDIVETDGIMTGDRPYTFGVTEQVQSTDPPFFVEAYLFPSDRTDSRKIEDVSDRALQTIGLGNSAFSIEMKVTNGEVRIIEVNGRLGWDDGFTDLFQVHTHQNRINQVVDLALGTGPKIIHDNGRYAALVYRPCYDDGIIESLPTKADLRRLETGDLKLGLSTNIGARFYAPPYPEVYPHVVWALATHPSSPHAAYQNASHALEKLDVEISKMTKEDAV